MSHHSLLDEIMEVDSAMLAHLGLRLRAASEGEIVLDCHPHPDLENSFGVVHGGLTFAALDTAAAYALAARGIHAATIASHITFSRAVSAGADVRARASIVTAGRTLATVRGELTVDGRIAALATFEFKVRSLAD